MLFEFKDINYSLGNEGERSINVSGGVKAGEVLIVRGPSGAGKSTLFRILSRLQQGNGGEAFLQGTSWLDISPTDWRKKIHYLPQKSVLFDGTVLDNLAKPFETRALANSKAFDKNRAQKLMEQLLLSPGLCGQDARTLSGGEASRLAVARALLIDPVILLLDEPTAALDREAQQALYSTLSGWLKVPDRAALLISHNNDYQQLDNLSYLDIEPMER